MANQSVLKRPKVRENLNRNAFDRSYVRNIHCSHGMLIPVMMEPCIAGTKGVINRQCFTRTFDIVSPAFPNVVQCFDFFKVPIRYLWSNWENWKTNINDINSSALAMNNSTGGITGLGNLPRMDFGSSLLTKINTAFIAQGLSSAQVTRFMNDYARLAEGLGYGVYPANAAANVKNLFPIAAYQKVYYDHYRNTSYEVNNPFAYNLDWLTTSGNVRDGLLQVTYDNQDNNVFRELFTLRYVNYRNDYFHNIYPSLMFSSTQNTHVPDWNAPSIPGIGSAANYFNPQYSSAAENVVLYRNSSSNVGALSVNAIRSAFALDKLLRASSYAPKHVRDQYKARFGVDIGDKVSYESERIGSFTDDIVFGEVTNQADTLTSSSGSPLGALGGKGIGASKMEKDLHFYCEEDSIIIGITYFLVRAIYDEHEDEWNNKLTREEFFQPEYQNLGLRLLSSMGVDVGYCPPYQRYKLGVDQNMGMFKNTYRVFNVNGTSGASISTTNNPLRSFTVHSDSYAYNPGGAGANYMFFKALPEHLDHIFRTSFDVQTGTPSTDQFYFNVMVKFAVTQNMSVHGMPSF